jgi:hypothetical protein
VSVAWGAGDREVVGSILMSVKVFAVSLFVPFNSCYFLCVGE